MNSRFVPLYRPLTFPNPPGSPYSSGDASVKEEEEEEEPLRARTPGARETTGYEPFGGEDARDSIDALLASSGKIAAADAAYTPPPPPAGLGGEAPPPPPPLEEMGGGARPPLEGGGGARHLEGPPLRTVVRGEGGGGSPPIAGGRGGLLRPAMRRAGESPGKRKRDPSEVGR